MAEKKPVFDSVIYWLSPTFSSTRRTHLAHVLDENAAQSAPDATTATHVVTNTPNFEGHSSTSAVVVTDTWVVKSFEHSRMRETMYYSPDPAKLFSGVVASSADIPESDVITMSAGIQALGGQWRSGLTADVTHLFAVSENSDKYAAAMAARHETSTVVLLPHWFDDTIRLASRSLPTTNYEWPNPPLWRNDIQETLLATVQTNAGGESAPNSPSKRKSKSVAPLSPSKRELFTTAIADQPSHKVQSVWVGRRVYLAHDLDLSVSKHKAFAASIERAGGIIVPPVYTLFKNDTRSEQAQSRKKVDTDNPEALQEQLEVEKAEIDVVDACDVFVCRYRRGWAYLKAARASHSEERRNAESDAAPSSKGFPKLVGSLQWLLHVQTTGILSSPLDQLLHYPVPSPRRSIGGFKGVEITISNYTGEARDYVKRLLTLLGVTFTPTMRSGTHVLVAASEQGQKVHKARMWNIAVVNHLWLEDCFVRWERMETGLTRYTHFPEGLNFSHQLGDRGLGQRVEENLALDGIEKEAEEEDARRREIVAKAVSSTSRPSSIARASSTTLRPSKPASVVSAPPSRKASGQIFTQNSAAEVNTMVSVDQGHHVNRGDELMDVDDDDTEKVDTTHILEESEVNLPRVRKAVGGKAKSSREDGPSFDSESERENTPSPTVPRKRSARGMEVVLTKSILKNGNGQSFSPGRKRKASPTDSDPDDPVLPVSASRTRDAFTAKKAGSRTPSSLHDTDDDSVPEQADRERPSTRAARGKVSGENGASQAAMKPNSVKTPVKAQPSKTTARPSSSKAPTNVASSKKTGYVDSDSDIEVYSVPSQLPSDEDDFPDVLEIKVGPPRKGRKQEGTTSTSKARSSKTDKDTALKSTRTRGRRKAEESDSDVQEVVEKPSRAGISGKQNGKVAEEKNSKTRGKRKARESGDDGEVEEVQEMAPPLKRTRSEKKAEQQTKVSSSTKLKEESMKLASPQASASSSAMQVDDAKSAPSDGGTPITARSRRPAATRASAALHDVLMPDLMRYESEKKRGKSGPAPKDWELLDSDPGKSKKRKAAKDEAEGSRKTTKVEETTEPVNSKRRGKQRTGSVKGSGRSRQSIATSGLNGFQSDMQTASAPKGKAPRMMSTGVEISENIVKAMSKLGMRLTNKANECTHLLAPRIMRTEKFLLCMAFAPHVLKPEWAIDSAEAGYFLPEADYVLKDEDGERKLRFPEGGLAAALVRAKAHDRTLFMGHTFFITPGVKSLNLLRDLVLYNGGKSTTRTPSTRALEQRDSRHLVSCKEDEATWKSVVAEHPVYNAELLLTSVLTQRLDLDDENCRLTLQS
ncbi:hypothetical protein FISHEDRAFT_78219 [Fistulina hepatica ATCC 64428]|nr:hypothetical protein FISHEDRAFT_78219 [Fistulina hepatica ATCC 64428]